MFGLRDTLHALSRDRPWVFLGLLLCFGFAPSRSEAQEVAQVQLPHDPTHADEALRWCGVHFYRSEIAAALSDCDYAVASKPNDPAAISNRGSVWLGANEPARALRDFEVAIALAPAEPGMYFNRGIANARLGNVDRAIGDYTMAIRLKPSFAHAYHNRAYEFEKLGRREEAVADYQHALKLFPDLGSARDGLNRLGGR